MTILRKKRLKRRMPAFKAKSIGVRLYASPRAYLGIGDALQFSSLPENFFRNYGQCLIDIDHHWIFDHNPYVIRFEKGNENFLPEIVVDLWQDVERFKSDMRRSSFAPKVFTSNAEAILSIMQNVIEGRPKVYLNHPRLYYSEGYPFEKREMILLHTTGRSNGEMPDYLIDHVVKKYKPTGKLVQIAGPKDKIVPGLPLIRTATLWAAAEVISRSRLFIGPDSGLAWIAACYPDVQIKKIRLTKPWGVVGNWHDWVPLQLNHPASHWDDTTLFQLYNLEDFDSGIFKSWREI